MSRERQIAPKSTTQPRILPKLPRGPIWPWRVRRCVRFAYMGVCAESAYVYRSTTVHQPHSTISGRLGLQQCFSLQRKRKQTRQPHFAGTLSVLGETLNNHIVRKSHSARVHSCTVELAEKALVTRRAHNLRVHLAAFGEMPALRLDELLAPDLEIPQDIVDEGGREVHGRAPQAAEELLPRLTL